MRNGASALVGLSVALVLAAPGRVLGAEIHHTVAKGHTLEAIANRYRVSAKAILEANHLTNAKNLQIGDVLTIPKPPESAAGAAKGKADEKKDKKDPAKKESVKELGADKRDKDKGEKKKEPVTYALKAKTPGVVHVKRVATTEEADVRLSDKRGGKVSPTALKSFERIMRSPTGAAHPIEPRLLALLGVVSNHFGSRKIEIVSGFRPFTPTQYTPHSNHNHGKAIDFRVVGVPNEVVRDYCRTLKNVGCGYYPNSTFVHMDARDASAFWIDYSKPGEPPRYNAANVQADEGTSDVHDDRLPAPVTTSALPESTPSASATTAPEPAPATSAPNTVPAPVPTPRPAAPAPPSAD